ncbi:hypothetical protein Cgig2_032093 [Carnegiea gigantea]|uniref:Uncharacterized protein n=1 Tax=Carnegiea gigantea TaxID=171969 RepID=A0A9Q1JRZ6_9CARY|nr:hypothetical protein Cgig2_032093 [Carnegiea gigantea]
MKKAFRVIAPPFQALPDITSADKSYHKRVRILESMSRVKSYVVLLDLECDSLVLDICHNLLSLVKDDHSSLMLAYVESILVGILAKADDFLLEFLISIPSRNLITSDVSIDEVSALMQGFFLRCMHIDNELAFVALPNQKNHFISTTNNTNNCQQSAQTINIITA